LFAKSRHKNNYWFLFGPSNSNGVIDIEWEQIVDRAHDTASFSVMDYASFEDSFNGDIIVELADDARLKRAISAFDQFSGFFPYPENYKSNIEAALQALQSIKSSQIRVEAYTNPSKHDLSIYVKECSSGG